MDKVQKLNSNEYMDIAERVCGMDLNGSEHETVGHCQQVNKQ
jgi:hypothetical protein